MYWKQYVVAAIAGVDKIGKGVGFFVFIAVMLVAVEWIAGKVANNIVEG